MALSEHRKAYLRAYQREWMSQRRLGWINENGPCAQCGSSKELQVDHINPESKNLALKALHTGAIWSWRDDRRNEELSKCQVLCLECHKKKTAIENGQKYRKHAPDGMAWCSTCKLFKDTSNFSKRRNHWNGLCYECRQCQKIYKDAHRLRAGTQMVKGTGC